ncbi:unnamed protein product, partial [Didymodactylos carnosus]
RYIKRIFVFLLLALSNATYSTNSSSTSLISRPNPTICQLDFSSSSTNQILLHLFNPLSTTTQQYNNTFIANSTWTTLTISLRSDASYWYLYAVYIYDQTAITGQNILLNGDYGTGTLYGWTITPSTNPSISLGSYVTWTGSKILCQTFPTVIGNTYLIRYSMKSANTTPYIIAAVTVGPYQLQTNASSSFNVSIASTPPPANSTGSWVQQSTWASNKVPTDGCSVAILSNVVVTLVTLNNYIPQIIVNGTLILGGSQPTFGLAHEIQIIVNGLLIDNTQQKTFILLYNSQIQINSGGTFITQPTIVQ